MVERRVAEGLPPRGVGVGTGGELGAVSRAPMIGEGNGRAFVLRPDRAASEGVRDQQCDGEAWLPSANERRSGLRSVPRTAASPAQRETVGLRSHRLRARARSMKSISS